MTLHCRKWAVVLRPGLDGCFESIKQFVAVRCASVRGSGRLADDDEGCPVFGVGLLRMLVDHRQHGFAQSLGVRELRIGGWRREGADCSLDRYLSTISRLL
jgi:hypothetical protein